LTERKKQEAQVIRKAKSLLEIDVRSVLEKVEAKYGLKLPRKVIMIDFGEDIGDLYIRFKNVDHTEGEPTPDGKIILHHEPKTNKIAAIEIINITTL
jgi:hypothetical protein